MSERLICGLQPVREAIAAHGGAVRVVVEDKRDAPQLDALARFARDRGASVERARRGDLDRASHGVRHQGAIAWAPALRLRTFEELELGERPLVVVLDSIEDPQNFGAIVRSAVAFGASAIVWPQHGAAPLTPATFRASAGAIEHAQLCSVPSLPNALAALRERSLRIVGLDASADRSLDAEDLTTPTALVLGAEGAGLHKSVRRACDSLARLPMRGPIASLNVSAAAAIALYEVTRQRSKKDFT
ncbi:MAG TPA: 23S rRNA (guanosine(2251)-2'-O)-methyltransferase RlmB [Polyangiaceae bacterium]|jgi:23S rRNA (guanosine2251-2'-O)-methyltransferase